MSDLLPENRATPSPPQLDYRNDNANVREGWAAVEMTSQMHPKQEPFDLRFGMGMAAKYEENELRIDDFTRIDALADTWLRGSPSLAFPAPSPATSDRTTTTPPSFEPAGELFLPGHGPGPGTPFGTGVEHTPWMGGFGEKRELPPLPPAHSYPYPPAFPGFFPSPYAHTQHLPLGPPQLSPPSSASSTSGSGGSSPFPGQHPAWAAYPDAPPTCDPRDTAPGPAYELIMVPPHLDHGAHSNSHAQAQAPAQAQAQEQNLDMMHASPQKRGRGRPRRVEAAEGVEAFYKATGPGAGMLGSPYGKLKRKTPGPDEAPGQGQGMTGWDDVDERTLVFTSRQEAKLTKTLRRQCFNCRTWRDVSAWRRSIMQVGHIVCNKCGLYEKAHKKARPLNDRGEFVRPGKHAIPGGTPGSRPASKAQRERARARSRSDSVVGAGVMSFGPDADADADADGDVDTDAGAK